MNVYVFNTTASVVGRRCGTMLGYDFFYKFTYHEKTNKQSVSINLIKYGRNGWTSNFL